VEALTTDLTSAAVRLHDRLRARGETLVTAESLTGGLVGAVLTAVPGASDTYRGGVIVYATDLKASLAGVPAELVDARGPVDPDVAVSMAVGVRERLGATWGVAVTGVAGPEPQAGKRVGTVYVATAGPDGSVVALHEFSGDRDEIRRASCREVLHAVYARLGDGE
jgi:nicotinamide-nucleotide amidase